MFITRHVLKFKGSVTLSGYVLLENRDPECAGVPAALGFVVNPLRGSVVSSRREDVVSPLRGRNSEASVTPLTKQLFPLYFRELPIL
jgi:hypothetical protein